LKDVICEAFCLVDIKSELV